MGHNSGNFETEGSEMSKQMRQQLREKREAYLLQ